jgi:hypothetical protein
VANLRIVVLHGAQSEDRGVNSEGSISYFIYTSGVHLYVPQFLSVRPHVLDLARWTYLYLSETLPKYRNMSNVDQELHQTVSSNLRPGPILNRAQRPDPGLSYLQTNRVTHAINSSYTPGPSLSFRTVCETEQMCWPPAQG